MAFRIPPFPNLSDMLLVCVCMCMLNRVQLFNPMDCSQPGFSAHGVLQARILVWVAISSSRGSFQPRDQTHISFGLLHWQMDSLPLAPLGRVFSLSYFPRNLYFGFFPSARHPEREILSDLVYLHLWHRLWKLYLLAPKSMETHFTPVSVFSPFPPSQGDSRGFCFYGAFSQTLRGVYHILRLLL